MKEDIEKIFMILDWGIVVDQIRSLGIETPDNKLKEIYSEYEKWLSKEDRDKLGSLLPLLPSTKQEVLEIIHKDAERWTTFDIFQEDELVAETNHKYEETNIRNFKEYIEDDSNRSLFQKLAELLRLPKKKVTDLSKYDNTNDKKWSKSKW